MKLRAFDEVDLPDVWTLGDEWLLMLAKERPAMVVSSEAEHEERQAARLVPLFKTTERDGYYRSHEAEIRAGDMPGLIWLDNVPITSAPDSRVIDWMSAVRFPLEFLANRRRIAVLDSFTLIGIKEIWSETILR